LRSLRRWQIFDKYSSFKSRGEREIAGFLGSRDIAYQYEYPLAIVDQGDVTPTQPLDIFGIRADLRLESLSVNSSHAGYYVLGFDLSPEDSLYWGFTVLDGRVKGNLILRQSTVASIVPGDAEFDVVIGETYNLAIVFNDTTDEYYFYFNGEKKTVITFPDSNTGFDRGHLRMYTRDINSRFEFDNIEYAMIPEPASILLMGLSSLFLRKRKI
jgi:hypothetical protein